jgi:hypothetical protein
MFLKPTKPSATAPRNVEFTAKDLNDTIALHRRISAEETRLARVFDPHSQARSGRPNLLRF